MLAWRGGGFLTPLKNNNDVNTSNALTEPIDTSKYWDESDEIKALINAGKTENQWKGSGTKDDPYLISSAIDLAWLSYRIYSKTGILSNTRYFYVDKYFKQTANIDVSKYWWFPIGGTTGRDGSSVGGRFAGKYDGDKHTISGVFVDMLSGDAGKWKGLFGVVAGISVEQDAEIKNIGVVDSIIKGVSYVGGIVGQVNKFVSITNCFNDATIDASSYIGGIIGYAGETNNIIIENCYNSGDVEGGSTYIGGIIGKTFAPVRSCYNKGIVNSAYELRRYVGGISGDGYSTYDCFNWGDVQGHNEVGGISGRGSGEIKNCYNTARVYGSFTGGIVGTNSSLSMVANCFNTGSSGYGIIGSSGTIKNCYYGGSCTATQGVRTGTDNTVKIDDLYNLARQASWYLDASVWDSSSPWDFEDVWNISPSILMGLPVFQWEYPYNYSGNGTKDNPYIIARAKDLIAMSNNVNSGVDNSAYFKQTADIKLTGKEWTPIGDQANTFMGNYDGGNFTISGLFVDSDLPYIGLFGNVVSAKIRNVNIKDSVFISTATSSTNVGSLVGYSLGTTIENCSSSAVIKAGESTGNTGGLLGYVGAFTGKNLTFNGSVTSGAVNVGGIVGDAVQPNISNCINYGNIEGTNAACNVGGIAGSLSGGISNSISNCTITTANAGGSIIGTGKIEVSLANCAGYGVVYCSDASKCGGLAGAGNSGTIKIINCSFNGSSNSNIGLFVASSTTASQNIEGSYSQIGSRKNYSSGDFSGFTVVANMNDDLPMQNALFSIAIGGQTSEEVIEYLEGKGFSLVA